MVCNYRGASNTAIHRIGQGRHVSVMQAVLFPALSCELYPVSHCLFSSCEAIDLMTWWGFACGALARGQVSSDILCCLSTKAPNIQVAQNTRIYGRSFKHWKAIFHISHRQSWNIHAGYMPHQRGRARETCIFLHPGPCTLSNFQFHSGVLYCPLELLYFWGIDWDMLV